MDLKEIGQAAESGASSWNKLVGTTASYGFFHSLQTALLIGMMALFGYAGYHMIHSGSIFGGLKIAFITSDDEKQAAENFKKTVQLQVELRQTEQANRVTRDELALLLANFPLASRVRVGLIHNGTFAVNRSPLLRWDITHAAANPGYIVGDMPKDMGLAQWADFLSDLIADRCAIVETAKMSNAASRDRMNSINTVAFAACPVNDSNGQLVGAIFLHFDDMGRIPPDKKPLFDRIRRTAQTIGSLYDAKRIIP